MENDARFEESNTRKTQIETTSADNTVTGDRITLEASCDNPVVRQSISSLRGLMTCPGVVAKGQLTMWMRGHWDELLRQCLR